MSDNDSASSGLSSVAPEEEMQKLAPIFVKAKKATKLKFPPPAVSPPRPKRPPSPPHEDAFADNPDIAFIVMFRSRFNEVMPAKLPNYGSQDIERGVTDQPPSPEVQSLLCALLSLVLNRKKPVERGHHGRALEEAVLTQKAQWPHSWNGVNPLHGPRDFNMMSPVERLNLLRTLIHWSFTSSEAVSAIIKDKYKQVRHTDDENQPLSVQPWGIDGDKRRYFLVQGLDDTHFKVYREGSRYTKNAHWYSMAGNIPELQALAQKLDEVDGTQAARRLAMKMLAAVPTFEASETKRLRREQRQIKRAAFTRPEPGFSMYEGRTRGKRTRYNYDDDEDGAFDSDATSARRSARPSTRATPLSDGPTYTLSGRQSRQPRSGLYGESLLRNSHGIDVSDELPMGSSGDDGGSEPPTTLGRATRSSANGASNPRKRKRVNGHNNIDEMSAEDEAAPSGDDDWDSDRNEVEDEPIPDADELDEELSEEESNAGSEKEPKSFVVKLKVSPQALKKSHDALRAKTEANQHDDPGDTTTTDDVFAGATVLDSRTHVANGVPNGHAATNTALGHQLATTPPPAVSAYPTPASGSFSATADTKPGLSYPDAVHHQHASLAQHGTLEVNGVRPAVNGF
ncbi:hypothetical protein LTR91_016266 [Friedmanniomyces endolithicus]|uniref:WHIM1 domain-containing protein n=1 Tax=Friedmanniomyces endolithicus TaxID=329885 RepID=A0A4U0U6Y2_9PEZI|nr:hypothetical protein LTS09_013385 [Friedmanniomyces endolithicus]KAK0291682.1 hypothetical protein LTR35_001110 [Friedmanniomyces endolithicus]KAK0296645.1 hypothetical protein LTS00_004970 [Friedmanniomyces endolithicus]KAK0324793.1 hypothetical protein LTR82_004498 [Friedmanniomyces endolithicus]KAK0932270.1 hypothetical protein LTR57_000490 [Friedmanniomyces endolithicus]